MQCILANLKVTQGILDVDDNPGMLSEVSVVLVDVCYYMVQVGVGDGEVVTVEEMDVDGPSEVCYLRVYLCDIVC